MEVNIEEKKILLEMNKILAEVKKINAETKQIEISTAKIYREMFFYPLVVLGGLTGLIALILKFIH